MISVLIPMATSLLRQRSDGKPLDCNPRDAGVQERLFEELRSVNGKRDNVIDITTGIKFD